VATETSEKNKRRSPIWNNEIAAIIPDRKNGYLKCLQAESDVDKIDIIVIDYVHGATKRI
jgi:hypothetical protein